MTADLEAALGARGGVVGFEVLNIADAPGPLWGAAYARMLLVVQARLDPGAVDRAQDWLLRHIAETEEASGQLLDGYLIVAITEAGDEASRGAARRLERDPRGCRKHLVWCEQGQWTRLERVTVLGLPGGTADVGPVQVPALPEVAVRLLQWDAELTLAQVKARLEAEIDDELREPTDAPR